MLSALSDAFGASDGGDVGSGAIVTAGLSAAGAVVCDCTDARFGTALGAAGACVPKRVPSGREVEAFDAGPGCTRRAGFIDRPCMRCAGCVVVGVVLAAEGGGAALNSVPSGRAFPSAGALGVG